jgi:thiamine pyrophosphate-dependent acetolactate synthase large subunit-like protein
MMGAVVHSNVGLMHASMAIFNAWCDRVPMLILGATVPGMRRAAGRGSTGSTPRPTRARWCATTRSGTTSRVGAAAYEALLRASQMAQTAPCGPTYINLDAAIQESKIGPLPPLPDVAVSRPASRFPSSES